MFPIDPTSGSNRLQPLAMPERLPEAMPGGSFRHLHIFLSFLLTSDPRQPYLHVGCLPKVTNVEKEALLQGTLDLLILRTLVLGSRHGQGIARSIQQESEDVFLVDHGSLYLALQRLEEKGWLKAEWGVSENNRRARFYTLTAKGRAQLAQKTDQWYRIAAAISRILSPRKTEA